MSFQMQLSIDIKLQMKLLGKMNEETIKWFYIYKCVKDKNEFSTSI